MAASSCARPTSAIGRSSSAGRMILALSACSEKLLRFKVCCNIKMPRPCYQHERGKQKGHFHEQKKPCSHNANRARTILSPIQFVFTDLMCVVNPSICLFKLSLMVAPIESNTKSTPSRRASLAAGIKSLSPEIKTIRLTCFL